jgi:glyoxylase-like metal-dependent hydrolase (beta-lactamase superfamily II)
MRPGLGRNLPPGYESLTWVANSATLIYGERDAVLVDTFLTNDQNAELVEQVAATGKNLTHIYITHGHGDHFFGIDALKERFPNATFDAMIKLYPDRANPGSLWGGANAAKAAAANTAS